MNNGLIPERHLGQGFARGLLAVDSALRADKDPKGDMKAEATISILLITHRHAVTHEADPESYNQQ